MILLFCFQLRSTTELDQDILNDCLTIQAIQVPSPPRDVSASTVQQSPGHVHDLYSGIVFFDFMFIY